MKQELEPLVFDENCRT